MHDVAWLSLTRDDVPVGDDWLSAAEREVQARLMVPKRRNDWRLGRYTAKRALASWFAAPHDAAAVATVAARDEDAATGVERAAAAHLTDDACDAARGAPPTDANTHLPPTRPLALADTPATLLAQLEVLAASDGAPEAWRDGQRLRVSLSLSHSQGRSLVALGAPDIALGCDIERIERRSAAFVADYFTADEQAFLSTRPTEEHALWATLIWSAKESALKALRQGLRLPTRAVEVRLPAESNDGSSNLSGNSWRTFTVDLLPQGPRLCAAWRVADAAGGWISTLAQRGSMLEPLTD